MLAAPMIVSVKEGDERVELVGDRVMKARRGKENGRKFRKVGKEGRKKGVCEVKKERLYFLLLQTKR